MNMHVSPSEGPPLICPPVAEEKDPPQTTFTQKNTGKYLTLV